jgi:hypothetical protein
MNLIVSTAVAEEDVDIQACGSAIPCAEHEELGTEQRQSKEGEEYLHHNVQGGEQTTKWDEVDRRRAKKTYYRP